MKTISIIGGGIGGLTTAIALKQKGFQVRIFEQSPVLKPVGAGIILANNAMQVYQKLGLEDRIAQAGNHISVASIVNADLSPLSYISLQYFEEKYSCKNIAIHRGALQQVLLNELATDDLHLNKKLSSITQNEAITLTFTDGSSSEANLVIGADGIHSAVRQSIFPDSTVRNAHQICWRGVTDMELPEYYQHAVTESWGLGDRFGFVKIAPRKVYWFAVRSYKDHPSEIKEDFFSYFNNYHPLVKELLTSTPADAIHLAELSDLKPMSKWSKQNTCLIGDAAHATTPNMGQGAGQAIEDAYLLAECIANFPAEVAFAKFQKLREVKVNKIVKTSWTIGKMAHLQNPLAARFRNFMMRMVPNSLNRKQIGQVFELAKLDS